MGGRRQHVRDQGAISEHLDRLGMSIDEGLVETGLIHHTLDLVEKGTSCSVKARSHRFDRLQVLDRPVVGAPGDHAVPHVHLADQTGEERSQVGSSSIPEKGSTM